MASPNLDNGNNGIKSESGPIVNVTEETENSINELFAIVNKPQGTQRSLGVPMRMRNFPQSFFTPPSSGSKSPSCHSRENSIDQSPFSPGSPSRRREDGSPGPNGNALPPPHSQSMSNVHNRAHSSPATLQQTLAVAQQQQQQQHHLHLRQPSYDVSSPSNLGPLPPGWEQAFNKEGRVYYLNHRTKTTHWEDPREQLLLQRQQQQQQQQQQLQQQQQQQQQQMNGAANRQASHVHQRVNSVDGPFDPLGPLPDGWDQQVDDDGLVYFRCHVLKQTTRHDPRLVLDPFAEHPVYVQGKNPNPSLNANQNPSLNNQNANQNQNGIVQGITPEQRRQQEVRLLRLENERRILQQRQMELRKMELERRQSRSQENMQAAVNQTQEMFMRQSLGDSAMPSQHPVAMAAQSELHNRQESADSGVCLGSGLNLGSIPEDLPVDDVNMDTSSAQSQEGPQQQQQQQAGNGNGTVLEPDQILTSLGDVLPQDIMQDVLDPNRGLTWL